MTWAFINGYENKGTAAVIGHGTASQWGRSEAISEKEALPGDLVFLQQPVSIGINHVGIVVGHNDDGKLVVIHCNAGDNGVVAESAYSAGFRYVRRPVVYDSMSAEAADEASKASEENAVPVIEIVTDEGEWK